MTSAHQSPPEELASEASPTTAHGWRLGWGSLKSYGGASLLGAIGGVACYMLFSAWLFAPEATGFDPEPWSPWAPLTILAAYFVVNLCGVVCGLLALSSVWRTRRLTAVDLVSGCALVFCSFLIGEMVLFLFQ